jgi:glycosyltransferase involved in cell wall biosynthesis
MLEHCVMPKLLFLTPELPYPPQSGGKVKSLKLLDALSERHEITLVCPLKLEDPLHRDAFAERSPCREHLHCSIEVPRSAASLIASYARGRPLNVHRSYDAALAAQVARLADEHDLVFVDHYEAAAYLPANYPGPVIYHAHNAYHQIWQRFAELPGKPAYRAAAWLEAKRVRRAELQIARRADLVFASPNDAELLTRGGIDRNRIAPTYHLGDDTQLALPELRFSATEKRLLYVGLLSWEANVQGLLWFLADVWPAVKRQHPDLAFDIVGKNPTEKLRSTVAALQDVELLGFVESLEEVYQRARVSVAPLLFGSGMKVKVLDAMARGMPTVTTAVGAEGVDYTNGKHLAVTKTAADMGHAINRLLIDEAQWTQQMRSSRELIAQRYTWRRLFDGMHRNMDEVLTEHSLRRATTLRHA